MGLSRREFLATAGAFAAATGMSMRDAMAQTKFRLRQVAAGGGGSGSRITLQASDFTFLGYVRFDESSLAHPLEENTGQAIAGWRRSATTADVHFFTHTKFGGVAQYGDLSGITPNLDVTLSPTLPLVRDWGYPFGTTIRMLFDDGSETGSQTDCGLTYDAARGVLWKSYVAGYGPQGYSPGYTTAQLNHGAGTAVARGPFRASQGNGFHSGAIVEFPSDMAAALGGYSHAGTGAMGSGISTKAFGTCLHPWNIVDPAGLTTVLSNDGVTSFPSLNLMQADETHQRATTTDYQVCGWPGGNYDCRLGISLVGANGLWGTVDPGTAENNNVLGGQYIQYSRGTDTVEGLFYWGFMVDNSAPCQAALLASGTGMTKPHMWYGNYVHGFASGSGWPESACCHYLVDPRWRTTGPGTFWRDPKYWIFSRAQVLSSTAVGGAVAPDAIYPAAAEAQRLSALAPIWDARIENFNQPGTGSYFDVQTKRFYMTIFLKVSGVNRPCLMVWQLS